MGLANWGCLLLWAGIGRAAAPTERFEFTLNLSVDSFHVSDMLYDAIESYFFYLAGFSGKFWFREAPHFKWVESINQQPLKLPCLFEPKGMNMEIRFGRLGHSQPLEIDPVSLRLETYQTDDFEIKFYGTDPTCDFDHSRLELSEVTCHESNQTMTLIYSSKIGCVNSAKYTDRLVGKEILRPSPDPSELFTRYQYYLPGRDKTGATELIVLKLWYKKIFNDEGYYMSKSVKSRMFRIGKDGKEWPWNFPKPSTKAEDMENTLNSFFERNRKRGREGPVLFTDLKDRKG